MKPKSSEELEIIRSDEDNTITYLKKKTKVKKLGDSGYISLPRELIDKQVVVVFEIGVLK